MKISYAGMIAVAAGAIAMPAQAITRAEIAALIQNVDAQFVCPETLSSDAERQANVTAFSREFAASHISYAQATTIMGFMLKKHRCATVIAEPAAVVEAAPTPAPTPVQAQPVVVAVASPG